MANDHVKMFTEEYGPIAEQVSKKTGIAPSVLLAQWGMESKYGRSPAGHFNFGNIKDLSGTGKEATDNKTKSVDKYLNFESPEAFGDYYANLMRRLYPNALNTGTDIAKYTEGLRNGVKGSYFEDPNYEDAIRGAYKVTSNFYSNAGGDSKEANPNDPFSSGVPLADKARESSQAVPTTTEPPPPTTLLEKASALANEADPTYGAVAGAVANYGGSKLVKPPLTPAEIASLAAEEKLRLDRLALRDAAPMGFEDIQKSYDESQRKLEAIKNEQKLREMQLKSFPPASPPPAPTPQEQLEIESRKITGAGAPYNTVQAFASERVPYSLASQAIDMTHSEGHGKGAHDIVDVFNQGKQKASDLGLLSGFKLTGEKGPGELYLPDELADPKNAEIQQRVEANQNQQAIFEQQQEQERLRLQAELDRISKERALQGSQLNALAGQVRDVKPLKKAVTTSEQAAELARYKAKLKAQNQPLTPQDILNKGKSVGRTVGGGAAGYYGVMSFQEALERFKAGDTSEGVLQALGALSATAALAPPVTPKLSGLKKAGTLGAVGMGGREIYRRLTQEPPAQ